ncbi:unnamed protein product, partial [Mesorhabditis belari]|uniref:PCI domain-containing protein n=1 Tax=Mesorhabditis belari TaxID=2138241 RepID=A0AAF3FU41_9BILA
MAPMANQTEKMEVDEPKIDTKDKEGQDAKKEETPKDLNAVALENLKEQCALLDKGEYYLIGRVLHVLHKTRKQINTEVLHKLISTTPFASAADKEQLLKWIPAPPAKPAATNEIAPMEVDAKASKSPRPFRRPALSSSETDLYIYLLTMLHLFDVNDLANSEEAAKHLIQRFDQLDKRTLDPIVAKAYFYLALIAEKNGRLDAERDFLNARLRTATLRCYTESQAVLIYTLLRAYLVGKHYPSAVKLVSKVTFPEGASNNDLARFLYYQGRIKAMQLDYNAAAGYFLQAIRKAPQDSAIGFKQNVQKWIVVVGLLQGEIPERSVFRQPIYRYCLAPYLALTQSVRVGDLVSFNEIVDEHNKIFEKDETLTLIVRLRQNVIRAAIKQIASAYSRISIRDIATKLQLQTEIETEYMVAKAIADGGIEAQIVSEGTDGKRYMRSNEMADVYRTDEPQHHYDNRIRYCLELHNQAVKALRFPPKDKPDVETIEQQREREQQELEFAKELAEEDDDDF